MNQRDRYGTSRFEKKDPKHAPRLPLPEVIAIQYSPVTGTRAL